MKVVIVGAVAGADQRINALAMANRMGATIDDVAESELCYAPQFGSANDPLNVAAMNGTPHPRGDMPVARGARAARGCCSTCGSIGLAVECVPGALHIPLEQLRGRLAELPRDREF